MSDIPTSPENQFQPSSAPDTFLHNSPANLQSDHLTFQRQANGALALQRTLLAIRGREKRVA